MQDKATAVSEALINYLDTQCHEVGRGIEVIPSINSIYHVVRLLLTDLKQKVQDNNSDENLASLVDNWFSSSITLSDFTGSRHIVPSEMSKTQSTYKPIFEGILNQIRSIQPQETLSFHIGR